MTRRQLRENIFKALFRIEFAEQPEREEQVELYLQELAEQEQEDGTISFAKEEDIEYVKNKVLAVIANLEAIDAAISEHTEGWKLGRIGKAELAILRLAVYEIRMDEDVPQGVAINEAVELTKKYCDEDAKGFVNAVLGKLTKA
ncbi:MAG: transcription antitermination factor NusB [Lachnospiraceae bacterium]|nr:transcription antitermination factor NusB [Lachnospiraceae bacterium]